MAGEVIVDALPYVDQGYDEPGVREAAYALVEEETRRYRPTKNYLEHLAAIDSTPFVTEVLKNEFERMAMRQPMDMLSMKRYELPPPPIGRQNDITAWTECVENSMAQLEHQAERVINLELLQNYGSHAWRSHNDILVKMVEMAQHQVQDIKKQIQEVNWKRKNKQTASGPELTRLQESWASLVSKNFEIERACLELEYDTSKLEQQVESLKPKSETQYGQAHQQSNDVHMEESDEEEEEDDEDDDEDEDYAAPR
ncbi:pre-mRNA-splicing factor SPF27 [Strongylocentrotus purpuratus]|uniref:Pre-mRNA-splicing factor SPF27 n=1 Tax=Strongylocentrotus purpuratus TaxID=7668 RepID=A0A7M7RBM7_STRPU|nr:pre-mRNA-splicing factor SPF27 [Strongylocentrotus purpuratus]|eukprot:XP_781613.2 PREDICTED: pre-mRNA-splicing factor SPF27 [Strongylocentrotus purpuratus]